MLIRQAQLLIVLLLLSVSVYAEDTINIDWFDGSGGGSSPTYLYDFEEVGVPTGGSTSAGSPNYDYTATILEGTESLFLGGNTDSADTRANFTITESNIVSYSVLLRLAASGGGNSGSDQFIVFYDNTTAAALYYFTYVSSTTYKLQARAFGGSGVDTVDTISIGTTYLLCIDYQYGTGSDAYASIGFVAWTGSETCPTSGNAFAESTDGTRTSTTLVDTLQLTGEYSSGIDSFDTIFDGVAAR